MKTKDLIIRWLKRQDYHHSWLAMQQFTNERDENTADEIWLLEHHPVFTQGQSGKAEHVKNLGNIPIVHTDRGGQVTYHGPGQLMLYSLIDLKRHQLSVRGLVSLLEQAVIAFLALHNIEAYSKCKAPGVYVGEHKICSIGLRIRRGCAYHGIAFNVAMDLEPFTRINPCGFQGLIMTQFADLGGTTDLQTIGNTLVNFLIKNLGYTNTSHIVEV